MKPGLAEIQSKALLEHFEKRQMHPIDALQVMSITSLGILASYIEYDMNAEEKTLLAGEIEKFSGRLRELLQFSQEDLFAVLLSTQVLNRELIESAVESIETAAKEAAKKHANPAPVS